MNMYIGGVNITIYDRIDKELENYNLNDKENVIYNLRFVNLEDDEIQRMLMTKESILDYLKGLMAKSFFIADFYTLIKKDLKAFKRKEVRI